MNQPTDLEKNQILKQILKSPEFHDSKRFQELLQYLVDKSSKGESLKETEIAHDLFSKDYKYDPSSDSLIRSYISNLRKKLEHYYLTTSDKYNFRLDIPKGQYHVKYTPVDQAHHLNFKLNYSKYIFPALVVLMLIVLIIREYQHNSEVLRKEVSISSPIWKDFVQNKFPVLIAIGDYVVLSEKGKMKGRNFLRVPSVNNTKELLDSVKLFPKKFSNLEISDVSYIGAGAALGLTNILNLFKYSDVKISTKLSKEVTWDDIEKNNIIFIGSLKTLYRLDTLLSRTNIKYGLNPNSLTVLDKKLNKEKFFQIDWRGGNYEKNYSLILKQSLSNDKSVILITGFSEVSVMDAVKNAVDPAIFNRVEKFSKTEIPNTLTQFELISEVEGLRYNVLRSEIKHFGLSLK